MQTLREVRTNNEETVIPNGYKTNGWPSVLPYEMNVLFHSLCYVVTKYETKADMQKGLDEVEGLQGTFEDLDPGMFKDKETYENYIQLLNKHKRFLERSNFAYPGTKEEAIETFIKWGLVLDKGDVWDIPVHPFPDVQEIFTLTEREQAALNYSKLEALVHPVFSRLVLTLHEQDTNEFSYSKNDLKDLLKINDAMLMEVLIKLIPYLQDPIDNLPAIPDDEKIAFTVVWERIYEDFLGSANPQLLQ